VYDNQVSFAAEFPERFSPMILQGFLRILSFFDLAEAIEMEKLRVIVGPDLRRGERVQLLIPGNTFHTARLIGRRHWFLGASTEWPGVVPADVEIGDVEKLAAKYPDVAADLRAIKDSIREN